MIEEHRKRATLVWVGMLVTIVGCEERADSIAVARNSGSRIFVTVTVVSLTMIVYVRGRRIMDASGSSNGVSLL